MTFAAPIKVVIRLVVWDVNEETGVQSIRDVKEQEVYFGEIPLMTDSGTFIINGTERVIVSPAPPLARRVLRSRQGQDALERQAALQRARDPVPRLVARLRVRPQGHPLRPHRSPPQAARDRAAPRARLLDARSCSTTSTTPRRSTSSRAKKYSRQVNYELLVGQRATRDIKHPKTKEVLVKKNRKFTKGAIRKLQESGVDLLPIDLDELVGKVSAKDVIDESTGEVLLQCNEELTEAKLDELRERGVEKVEVLFIDNLNVGPYLRNTLLADKLQGPDEAVMEIYRRLRPGDQPTLDTAQTLFHNLFFNAERYDLSRVGRLKLNYKFKIDEAIETQILTKRDILETVRYLIELRNGRGVIDDIDHLGNRRVRAVGELMENQYRIGLVRMERAIKERMSMSQEIETLMPHDLINAKPVSRGGQGVLRQLAAVAVHGPDEPALRGHAQAPPVGARTRRSDARARGLRSPRRAPDALRPHLPDRDAGRSEHRSHRVAVDVRARQRVRLHRDAVPRGRAGQDLRGGPVLLGAPGGGPDHRAGERRREGRQARR